MEHFSLLPRTCIESPACDLEVVLYERRPLRLTRARGRRIVCLAGRAWITAPGVFDDVILDRGESWEIGSDGLVLVEAVGSATVAIGGAENRHAAACRLGGLTGI